MDCVLVQNGRAHEFWRNTSKSSLNGKYTAEIFDAIVEIASPNTVAHGYVWNGASFDPPVVTSPPTLSEIAQRDSRMKSVIATMAVVTMEKDRVAWNLMTQAQKIQAVKDELDVWKTFREWVDDKAF